MSIRGSIAVCETSSIDWWCRLMGEEEEEEDCLDDDTDNDKNTKKKKKTQAKPRDDDDATLEEKESLLLLQSHDTYDDDELEDLYYDKEMKGNKKKTKKTNDGDLLKTLEMNSHEEDDDDDYHHTAAAVKSLDLLQWHTLAIPVSYWVVGTLQGLFRTFLNVYPLDLGANEAQQTTLSTMATLPAAFKILYGFSSDTIPLFGYKRKSHLFLAWLLASIVMGILNFTSDLTLQRQQQQQQPSFYNDDSVNATITIAGDNLDGSISSSSRETTTTTTRIVVPENAPSLFQLSWCFFVFGLGMWYADATVDAVVAEKAQCEPEAIRGSLQATCYTLRFFGLMVSAPISTYLYTHIGPQFIVTCLTVIPCIVVPLAWLLAEQRVALVQTRSQMSHRQDSDTRTRSTRTTSIILIKPVQEQCREIWHTVCSRSVWEPMAFVYMFNLCQVSNAAWRQFLVTVYHFTADNLNALLVVSYILVYLGTIIYKNCLLNTSWRWIYQACICLNLIVSLLQLLLIRGHTWNISPFVFALGDDAFAEFLNGIQFLPAVIMMVALCPPGSEGASYAMFTTVMNSALMISPAISSLLLGIWDVSKEALEQRDLDGLFNLSLLTTAIQTSPLLFLHWLPHGRQELEALASQPFSGSPIGGGIFLFVLFASMAWTLVVAILNITHPNWAGGS